MPNTGEVCTQSGIYTGVCTTNGTHLVKQVAVSNGNRFPLFHRRLQGKRSLHADPGDESGRPAPPLRARRGHGRTGGSIRTAVAEPPTGR
jgi:hypothetical protein